MSSCVEYEWVHSYSDSAMLPAVLLKLWPLVQQIHHSVFYSRQWLEEMYEVQDPIPETLPATILSQTATKLMVLVTLFKCWMARVLS